MQQERETREQAGWNLKADFSRLVLGNLQGAGDFYAEGNIPRWFWSLSATRELVNHDLKSKEVIILDKQERNIKKGISIWNRYVEKKADGDPITKSMSKNIKTFTDLIMKYQRNLMALLKKMGYFPAKENREELSF